MSKGLIASIALNVFLLASVLGLMYGWPLFIHAKQVMPMRERHVSFFEEFGAGPEDVVFVGDQITEEGHWDELFPGLPVKNRGIAGDTSADLALRIGQIAASKPGKVFLMVGGGDAAAEKSVTETAASFDRILSRLSTDSPGSEVYVQSILPRGDETHDGLTARNDAIREVAEKYGAVWVDLFPLFVAENGTMRDELSNDQIHLLASGYLVWRDAIEEHVR